MLSVYQNLYKEIKKTPNKILDTKMYQVLTSYPQKEICLINNYSSSSPTDRIERMVNIIQEKNPNIELKTVPYSQIDFRLLKTSIGLILSGSKFNVSEFYNDKGLEKKFRSELKLIQKAKQKPILAICYGLHLTALAFKGKVQRKEIPSRGSRIISISLKKTDELIPYSKIPINISHHDYISPDDSNIQKNFDIIATSEINGFKAIQYMRHKKRPIFSVQFHPETHNINYNYSGIYDKKIINKTMTIGEEIINNFVLLCNQ